MCMAYSIPGDYIRCYAGLTYPRDLPTATAARQPVSCQSATASRELVVVSVWHFTAAPKRLLHAVCGWAAYVNCDCHKRTAIAVGHLVRYQRAITIR